MTGKINETNSSKIELRDTKKSDLEKLFIIQLDKEANFLAAFTSKNPEDKEEYINKWSRLLVNPDINIKTITQNNTILGSIAKYEMDGKAELTYWIDKAFWGLGIGTNALKKFLKLENHRPIFARVAFDNFGSQRVLEKCGFEKIGTEKGFANARGKEIEEYIYKLK